MRVTRPAPRTLALDLEGTLISNAVSQFPRSGLYAFLERARAAIPHVVLFTGVETPIARAVLQGLAAEGLVPAWFATIDIVEWEGRFKDLRVIPDAELAHTVLVDDMVQLIHPDQMDQWVPIAPFVAPYPADDQELARVADVLEYLAATDSTESPRPDPVSDVPA